MRAVVTEQFGAAPVVVDLPTPEAGPGEIRVRVRASSFNGFDIALAGGYLRGAMEHLFPVVLGRDYAGTVDQAGAGADAAGFAVGDDVFGVVLTQPLHAGGFGEHLVIPVGHNVTRMPAGLDHTTAGALGLAGASAVDALEAMSVRAGETLLVSGATGGVGALVVQLAAARGASVVATAASGAAAAHVRALGAAHVVDHTGDLSGQVRAIAAGGVDAVLHLAGDPLRLADLVVAGGRFVSLLSVGAEQLDGRPITAKAIYANPHRPVLDLLAAEVAAGRLRVPIQQSYSLDAVPQAFADFASGKLGKLAVTVTER